MLFSKKNNQTRLVGRKHLYEIYMKQVIITSAQINVCMKVGMIGKKPITIKLNGLVRSDNFDTTDLSQTTED